MPSSDTTPATTSTPPRNSTSLVPLWSVFAAVHLLLVLLSLYAPGLPMGDVSIVYKEWIRTAVSGGGVIGIDLPFVYPIVALLPMFAAWSFGPEGYDLTWLVLVVAAHAAAFAFLLRGGHPSRRRAAWWWLAFLALLGPIAVGRIDAFTLPFALAGLVLATRRPALATVLLTIGAWVKVWPAAVVLATVIALRERRLVIGVAAGLSAAIAAIALVLGSGANVLSFVSDQTERGLQIEAPVSTIWAWLSILGVPDTYVFYDVPLNTFEVHGPGADAAAALMNPILLVAVTAIVLLGVRAVRAGADRARLVVELSLALVLVLIAVNKVGSPQYVVWLAAPIIAGLAFDPRRFAVPARMGLVVAALTQVIYPYLYLQLIELAPIMVVVLTARNVLFFVLLGWVMRELVRSGRPGSPSGAPTGGIFLDRVHAS